MSKSTKAKIPKQGKASPIVVKSSQSRSLSLNQGGGSEILQSNQYKSLALRSMFWRPDYLQGSSAWVEHLPFAFWIIEALQPSLFVELGTHYGHSYFSFCQAIKRLGLNTPSYAVDTWRGDDQAGHYDESVFQQVESYNQANYPEFSSLLRCTFDEALTRFNDGSIDLLHIDGCHTYEAVRHDFESWLPKLSDRAVVLFHDTNVRRDSFGVHKYFAELTGKYPYFEFIHGHGLGVFGVGKDQPELLRSLYNCYSHLPSRNIVYELFSRLGRSCHDLMDLNESRKQLQELQNHAHHLESLAHQRGADVELLTGEIAKVSEEIQARSAHVAQLEQIAGERGAEIERLGGEIARVDQESQARADHITHLEQVAAERGAEIESLNGEIVRLNEEAGAKASRVAHLEQVAGERGAEIERLNGELAQLNKEAGAKASRVAHLEQVAGERGTEILRLATETERLSASEQALHDQIRVCVSDLETARVEIEKLRTENSKVAAESRQRHASFLNAQHRMESLERMIISKEKELQEKSDEQDLQLKRISELEWYLGEREAWLGELRADFKNYAESHQQILDEIESKTHQIALITDESKAKSLEIEILTRRSYESLNEIERLKKEVAQLSGELKEKSEELNRYIKERVQIAEMITEINFEKTNITELKGINVIELLSHLKELKKNNERVKVLEKIAEERVNEIECLIEKRNNELEMLCWVENEREELTEKSRAQEKIISNIFKKNEEYKRILDYKKVEIENIRRSIIGVKVDSIVETGELNGEHHSHKEFSIKYWDDFYSENVNLVFRICVHNNQHGIIIFDDPRNHPLFLWEPNGVENEIEFCAFIFNEIEAQKKLEKMTTRDLNILRSIIRCVLLEYNASKFRDEGMIKWMVVAEACMHEISYRKDRLHYDDIEAKELGGDLNGYSVKIINPEYKNKRMDNLIVEFCEIAKDVKINITYDGDFPPLYGWSTNYKNHLQLTALDKEIIEKIREEVPNLVYHIKNQIGENKKSLRKILNKSKRNWVV